MAKHRAIHKLRVFHKLQQAHGALFRAADKALRRQEGITAAQHGVLLVLSVRDGRPISDIAAELSMGKSSLTGLVDRMSKAGLIRRQPSSEDGRVQEIFIEAPGKAILERRKDQIAQHNELLLAPFSASERRTIKRFLDHVRDQADEIIDSEKVVAATKE